MTILHQASKHNIVAGCYTPCKQGSKGGNRRGTVQITAGCYTPCKQGSKGGNRTINWEKSA